MSEPSPGRLAEQTLEASFCCRTPGNIQSNESILRSLYSRSRLLQVQNPVSMLLFSERAHLPLIHPHINSADFSKSVSLATQDHTVPGSPFISDWGAVQATTGGQRGARSIWTRQMPIKAVQAVCPSKEMFQRGLLQVLQSLNDTHMYTTIVGTFQDVSVATRV